MKPQAPSPHVKTHQGVSLYSRLVNRPVGRLIATRAHGWGLSANTMTSISALLTFTGIALLAIVEPSVGLGLGVTALLVLGFAFDSADGQVARMAQASSLAGEWFDHVVDAGKMVALHSAVLIAWFRFDVHETGWLYLPLGFQFVAVVTFSALTTVSLLKRLQVSPPRTPAPSVVRAIGLLPADYGILCLTFLLWGWTTAFQVSYLVLFVLNALIMVGFLARWHSELRSGDRRALS